MRTGTIFLAAILALGGCSRDAPDPLAKAETTFLEFLDAANAVIDPA